MTGRLSVANAGTHGQAVEIRDLIHDLSLGRSDVWAAASSSENRLTMRAPHDDAALNRESFQFALKRERLGAVRRPGRVSDETVP